MILLAEELTEDNITFIDEIGRCVPFFSKLGEAQRRELYKVCELIELQPKEVVFKAGDTGNAIFVVILGMLDLFMTLSEKENTTDHTTAKIKERMFRENAETGEAPPEKVNVEKQYIAGTYGPMATFGDNVSHLVPTASAYAIIVVLSRMSDLARSSSGMVLLWFGTNVHY
jgi:CRP-like cAMP-binding protein